MEEFSLIDFHCSLFIYTLTRGFGALKSQIKNPTQPAIKVIDLGGEPTSATLLNKF